MITVEELSIATEKDNTENIIRANAELLLEAINDYPTLNLKEPSDFIHELKIKIGLPLTYETLHNYEKNLSFENLWEKEALSSVLNMFKKSESKTLDELVEEISSYYKGMS